MPLSVNTKQRATTILVACLGTGAFAALGIPLPFLFGPLAFCLIAALIGLKMRDIRSCSLAARTILGVAIGASVTPDVLRALPQTGLSVAFIPLFVALIAVIGVPFFRRVAGLDPVTAYYASMPGGMTDMILFGIDAGANPRALSLIQATRVLIIATAVPLLLTQVYGVSLRNPIGIPATETPITQIALMGIAALVGWRVAERVGLFGASIIGPMILSAILSSTGVITVRPPTEALLFAQFFIGMSVGVHYVGVTLRELIHIIGISAAFMVILAILSVIFAEMVTLLGLAPPVEAFLSFAPGGQSEMTVLAIVVGADLGFVVTHHLTRVVIVLLGAPIAARWLARGESD